MSETTPRDITLTASETVLIQNDAPAGLSITDRVLLDRIEQKVKLTDDEAARCGLTVHNSGQVTIDEPEAVEKEVTLTPMEWRFLREMYREVMVRRIAPSQGRGGGQVDDRRLNLPVAWSLLDKIGLAEDALDACIEHERVPRGDFIMTYLERLGKLDELDID